MSPKIAACVVPLITTHARSTISVVATYGGMSSMTSTFVLTGSSRMNARWLSFFFGLQHEELVNRVVADAHALLRQVTIDIRLLS